MVIVHYVISKKAHLTGIFYRNTEELEDLRTNGLVLKNHTERHYRMVADFGPHELLAYFQDCEMFLRGMGGSGFGVLPFGFPKTPA